MKVRPYGLALLLALCIQWAQRQRSDKNQMFRLSPFLKPTFKWRSGCASAWAYGSKEEIISCNGIGTVKTVP